MQRAKLLAAWFIRESGLPGRTSRTIDAERSVEVQERALDESTPRLLVVSNGLIQRASKRCEHCPSVCDDALAFRHVQQRAEALSYLVKSRPNGIRKLQGQYAGKYRIGLDGESSVGRLPHAVRGHVLDDV
jgi:long-subunit acyl-CoA synthetase (AMP-forming)